MQGSVWGSLSCTSSMDKLPQRAYTNEALQYKYKGEVQHSKSVFHCSLQKKVAFSRLILRRIQILGGVWNVIDKTKLEIQLSGSIGEGGSNATSYATSIDIQLCQGHHVFLMRYWQKPMHWTLDFFQEQRGGTIKQQILI